MKYVALAVVLAVMQAAVPTPPKAPNPSAGRSQNVKNHGSVQNTPPQKTATVVEPISAQPSQQNSGSPSGPNTQQSVRVSELPPVSVHRDWADWVAWGLACMLVVIGAGGVRAAYKTLKTVEKQTQALVNAERAQVYVKAIKNHDSGGHATFTIRAKNYGGVPARVVSSVYAETALQFPDSELPVPPRYDPSMLLNEKFLEPRAKHLIVEFNPFSEPNRMRELSRPNSKLVVYGRIEYFDGISSTKRETRFAFAHVREKPSEIGGQVIRCGSGEYNLYT